jgi:hypothetical protein
MLQEHHCPSRTAGQQISHLLRTLTVGYRVHSNLPMDPILRHTNAVRTLIPSISILSTYLRLGLESRLFPSALHTTPLC